ncbi:Crp/Fnr family transcriptional regulator [bacterium]|nr:Crp/Fnr family transcriptional regulator [candidate division CSSED10-310 bacterium]
MNLVMVLKRSDLFADVGDSHLKAILSGSRMRHYEKNDFIFFEGDEGSAFYLLVEGSVKLAKSSADGQETLVKLVRPGEVFAEIILFEKSGYPVTAESAGPSKVLEISRKHFLTLLDDTGFRNEFIALLIRRQRYLVNRILVLTAYDVEERFFMFLRERYGAHQTYRIDVSKQDMASAIGTIPETFSRMLKRLKTNKTLRWTGKTLHLASGFWENREDHDRKA